MIGSGNVGSAAARTAAALGARVTVLTRCEGSADEYRPHAPTGVRVAVNTARIRRELISQADLVIGAILVSTFDTLPMISEADLQDMKPGSVIVDATCGYGDGYLPTAGGVQEPGEPPRVVHGVLHIKLDALPALVPVTATQAYTTNALPYLVRLARVVLFGDADPAVATARIAHDGELVHPVCREHAAYFGVAS